MADADPFAKYRVKAPQADPFAKYRAAPPEDLPAAAPPTEPEAPQPDTSPLDALAQQGRTADLQALDAVGNAFSFGAVPAMVGGITKRLAAKPGVQAGAGAQLAPDDTPDVRAAKEAFLAGLAEEPAVYENASRRTKERSEELRGQNPAFYTAMGLAPLAVPATGIARGIASLGAGAAGLAGKGVPAIGRLLKTLALGKEGKAIAQAAREADALAAAGPGGLTALQQLALRAPAVGASVGKGALRGGLAGATAGAFSGDEALARGDVAGFLKSMGAGTGVGLGLGGVGGLASAGAGKIASASTKGVANAEQKIAEKAAEKQAKAVASLRGELGAESQKASRQFENLLRTAGDKDLDPAVRKAAADMLASPQGIALRENVIGNVLRDAPSQVGRVKSAQEALREIIEAGEGNIAKDIATGKSLRETFKAQVAPRFATMGSRVIPPLVAAGLGGLIGGEENRGAGIAGGATLGSLLAATMGNPTLVMRNMARAPSVQRAAALGLGKLAQPLSRVGEPLMRAAPLAGSAAGAQFAPLEQYLSPDDEEALQR